MQCTDVGGTSKLANQVQRTNLVRLTEPRCAHARRLSSRQPNQIREFRTFNGHFGTTFWFKTEPGSVCVSDPRFGSSFRRLVAYDVRRAGVAQLVRACDL